MIALGIGKRPARDGGPPPFENKGAADTGAGGDTEPDPADPLEGAEGETEPTGGAGSVGPADVDYSDNDLCGSCLHMQGTDCAKYGFPVDPTGHCEAGYTPKDAAAAQDGMVADDGGGPPPSGPGPTNGGSGDWQQQGLGS